MVEAYQPAIGGAGARERILGTAYELFSRRGVRAVGIDEVIERAGVAKATLYRHFHSKDELVLAFLDLREQRWTRDFVEAGALSRGSGPEERLLAIFDVFDARPSRAPGTSSCRARSPPRRRAMPKRLGGARRWLACSSRAIAEAPRSSQVWV